MEDEIVDTEVVVMDVEEVVSRCSLEDCRLAGLACKHSHFVVGEAEEWSGDAAAGSDWSSFCGLYFVTTAVIPRMAGA